MPKEKKRKRAPGGGRKPLPPDQKRVSLSARVDPATKARITSLAKEAGQGIGEFLDSRFAEPE